MGNDKLGIRGQLNAFSRQRVKMNQLRRTLLRQQTNRLVHATATRANMTLGPGASVRQLRPIRFGGELIGMLKGQCRANDQRRAGGQASAHWYVAMDEEIDADGLVQVEELLDGAETAEDVVIPLEMLQVNRIRQLSGITRERVKRSRGNVDGGAIIGLHHYLDTLINCHR